MVLSFIYEMNHSLEESLETKNKEYRHVFTRGSLILQSITKHWFSQEIEKSLFTFNLSKPPYKCIHIYKNKVPLSLKCTHTIKNVRKYLTRNVTQALDTCNESFGSVDNAFF